MVRVELCAGQRVEMCREVGEIAASWRVGYMAVLRCAQLGTSKDRRHVWENEKGGEERRNMEEWGGRDRDGEDGEGREGRRLEGE